MKPVYGHQVGVYSKRSENMFSEGYPTFEQDDLLLNAFQRLSHVGKRLKKED